MTVVVGFREKIKPYIVSAKLDAIAKAVLNQSKEIYFTQVVPLEKILKFFAEEEKKYKALEYVYHKLEVQHESAIKDLEKSNREYKARKQKLQQFTQFLTNELVETIQSEQYGDDPWYHGYHKAVEKITKKFEELLKNVG